MNAELSVISPLAAYIGSFIEGGAPVWFLLILATTVHWFFLLLPPLAMISYLDRKLGADTQMRIGPNRVSIYGLFQGFADTVKLFFKEDTGAEASGAQESLLFGWGIVAAIVCIFSAIGSIPMAENWALSNLDAGVVGVLFAMIFSNLCLFWAAYSAHSEWSVLAAYRALSMVAAYLVPVAITIVPPILIAGSPNFEQIVKIQGGLPWHWIIFHDPGTLISFVVMFLAVLIWQGRVPFDHYKAPAELNDGLAAEYSGLRKGLLGFLEYASLFLACSLLVTTYMGGWQTPFNLESFGRAANLVEWLFFMLKITALVFISIWIRWSLPRLRIDQIVDLSWRVLMPAGFIGSILVAIWSVVFTNRGIGDFL